jgi:TonB family protein
LFLIKQSMSTTQIPPGAPAAPPPTGPRLDGSDLYDSGRWESAYTELHDTPTLLVQLQDDLTRSRKRESLWLSVIVHFVVIILLWNSKRFEKWFPQHQVLLVSPNDLMRQKQLTYLDMPPDMQKITKRPKTDKISDKDRIAMSRTPQLDTKELQKMLGSRRAGSPAPSTSPQPQAAPTQSSPAPQQQQPQSEEPQQPEPTNQIAKLQTQQPAPKPNFSTGSLSAGSAIAQAARAAATNRGGYGGDSDADYGLGQGRQAAKAVGNLDVLSDTMGVDFGPYLSRVLHDVRENWYNLIPEAARAPLMKKGKVSIEFAILKDGKVAGLQLTGTSGDVSLDRAAWGGITASNPFPPLPTEFGGQYLALRFHFYYNPDGSDLR